MDQPQESRSPSPLRNDHASQLLERMRGGLQALKVQNLHEDANILQDLIIRIRLWRKDMALDSLPFMQYQSENVRMVRLLKDQITKIESIIRELETANENVAHPEPRNPIHDLEDLMNNLMDISRPISVAVQIIGRTGAVGDLMKSLGTASTHEESQLPNEPTRRLVATPPLFLSARTVERTNQLDIAHKKSGFDKEEMRVYLVTQFNAAVDCFDCVRLDSNLKESFQIFQLMVDTARLRLSRWGHCIGIESSTEEDKLSKHPAESYPPTIDLLDQITELLVGVERIEETPDDFRITEFCDPQKDLGPEETNLHNKMRQLSIDQQNRSGLTEGFEVLFYDLGGFQGAIDAIIELIDALFELIPASKTMEEHLCDAEVLFIGTKEGIEALQHVASRQDAALYRALSKLLGTS